MVRKGQPWERPVQGSVDPLEVHGDDHDLATAVVKAPGALVRFRPSENSDVAREIGLYPGFEATGAAEIPMDALRLPDGSLACNMVVIGASLERLPKFPFPLRVNVLVNDREIYAGVARTVVVATGQFLGDLDVVPRGHPGDGRAEVQVYNVPRGERAEMRARLRTGTHVPHPRIREATGTRIDVRVWPAEYWLLDRRAQRRRRQWSFELIPEAYRVLI